MTTGIVTNIQRFCVHDGPGIRTTVFLKGCPLDCWWCHNPESRAAAPEIVGIGERCIRCGACVAACPEKLISAAGSAAESSQANCQQCGACLEACPTGAREWVGRSMTVGEVLLEVASDGVFYDQSGGGVTYSGGEPLLQAEFLGSLLRACHNEGIHTAVDTCGAVSRGVLLEIAQLTDLFLFDLKFMDDAKHRKYVGDTNKPILGNLEALGCVHNAIWIRIPVIPGVNDDEQELDAMVRFGASIPGVQLIELLPYHKTGIGKSQRLGRSYRLAATETPSADHLKAIGARFEGLGVEVRTGR